MFENRLIYVPHDLIFLELFKKIDFDDQYFMYHYDVNHTSHFSIAIYVYDKVGGIAF